MQFHLIVVSIFFKKWLKDHGDSSGQLLQRRMYHGALVSGFVNISVYFNKLVNNF